MGSVRVSVRVGGGARECGRYGVVRVYRVVRVLHGGVWWCKGCGEWRCEGGGA